MTYLMKRVSYRQKRNRLVSSLFLIIWFGIMVLGSITPPTKPPSQENVSTPNIKIPTPFDEIYTIEYFPRRGAANEPTQTQG